MVTMTQNDRSMFSRLDANPIYQHVFLAAITILAAALRFYKLGEWSFWVDEIFTIGHIQAHFSTLETIVRNVPPARNWVPLSLLLSSGVLKALGTSEWSARLAPALIGILSIPALYFLIKRMFRPVTALVAALLFAISPWHLYWSQNARFYTSLLLFYTLSLFAFFVGLERDRLRYFLLSGLLLYLATSERMFALFIVPVWLCYLVALKILPFDKPAGFRARNLLILSLPVLAGCFIEVYSWVTTGSSRFFGDMDWFFSYRTTDPLRMLSLIGSEIGIPLMVLAFFGGLHLVSQKNRAGLLIFVGAVIPVLLVLVLTPLLFTQPRYAFVTLPSWLILASVGVNELVSRVKGSGRIIAIGVLAALLADASGANLMYYYANSGNRHDWRGAYAWVQEMSSDGDLFVSTWEELGAYYLDQEVLSWQDLDPETVIQSGKRYWFVTDTPAVWANERMKLWVEENAELVDVRDLRLPSDPSLRIHLYDPVRAATAR